MGYKIFNIQINFDCKIDFEIITEKIKTGKNSNNEIKEFSLCLAKIGKYDEAVKLFLKLAETGSNDGEYYLLQAGYCYFMKEQYSKCIPLILKYLNLNDNDFQAHLIVGAAYHYLGLFNRANTHWWAAHIIDRNEFILKIMQNYFSDENHPERLALYPLCRGRGIDVGCGHRKTHPDCIGVDLNANGETGKYGNVKGYESVADIKTSGDDLFMFKDNELDFIVQRHNLEHYKDTVLTLQEWKRVLKPGGILGMVIPDEDVCNTIALDPTHYHVFTKSGTKRLLDLIGGFKIIKLEPLLKNWSFICILQKIEGYEGGLEINYDRLYADYEKSLLKSQAEKYNCTGLVDLGNQCEEFIRGM